MRPKEAAKAPELKNSPLVWGFYDPDVEVFNDFPDWIKEKIKGAVDYPGSALEKALGGGVAPKVDKGSQKEVKASKASVDEPEGDDGDW
jgi:hypothetical protein